MDANKKEFNFNKLHLTPRILKYLTLVILIGIIILLFKVIHTSTINNAKPEALYKKDNSVDLLVYRDTAYINASGIDWMNELQLTSSNQLGTIKRTNIKKRFKNFDATKLEVGTDIYSTKERDDIVLVKIGDNYVPYYRIVEG